MPRAATKSNMAKISKSYILTPPQPQGQVMSEGCEQPLDELTVQVWLLYHHPNFEYCTLFESRTELRTDRQTDDPITICPRRTFQAGGIKNRPCNIINPNPFCLHVLRAYQTMTLISWSLVMLFGKIWILLCFMLSINCNENWTTEIWICPDNFKKNSTISNDCILYPFSSSWFVKHGLWGSNLKFVLVPAFNHSFIYDGHFTCYYKSNTRHISGKHNWKTIHAYYNLEQN